jgi:hypothetical protein
VKVELHRADEPDAVLAIVAWTRDGPVVESDDASVREQAEAAFRRTPVVIDDGAHRRLGTSGEVLLQPGSLEWFRAVAQTRVPAETGLIARFVPGVREGGYDPAAGYRTFEESIERLMS